MILSTNPTLFDKVMKMYTKGTSFPATVYMMSEVASSELLLDVTKAACHPSL